MQRSGVAFCSTPCFLVPDGVLENSLIIFQHSNGALIHDGAIPQSSRGTHTQGAFYIALGAGVNTWVTIVQTMGSEYW